MNNATLSMLNYCWNNKIEKRLIAELFQEGMLNECGSQMIGLLQRDCFWLSEEAKKLKKRYFAFLDKLNSIPQDDEQISLMTYYKEYDSISNAAYDLFARTVNNLLCQTGPSIDECHIFVRQIVGAAAKKMYEQAMLLFYRYCVLSGNNIAGYVPVQKDIPDQRNIENSYNLLRKATTLNEFLTPIDDYRGWKYELVTYPLYQNESVDLFVNSVDYKDAILSVPGIVSTVENNGNKAYCGRGCITNIQYNEFTLDQDILYPKDISCDEDILMALDVNRAPRKNLDSIYGMRKYVIKPEDYFSALNKKIIINYAKR